jgi:hypothetical protein
MGAYWLCMGERDCSSSRRLERKSNQRHVRVSQLCDGGDVLWGSIGRVHDHDRSRVFRIGPCMEWIRIMGPWQEGGV